MISCPNCNHHNPDGATQCEACYTPLPATTSCPNCGNTVQADATFCGQCGQNLAPQAQSSSSTEEGEAANPSAPLPATVVSQQGGKEAEEPKTEVEASPTPPPVPATAAGKQSEENSPPVTSSAPAKNAATQLQIQTANLLHLQTDTKIELPQNLELIHIGKPNDQIPPDIDVSGFPQSEIVSRVHADIRVEGDIYYIEDMGSSNGTYINHTPLVPGNRHRLRPGDRIGLGKGDKMTFIFQLSQ